jgi:hypothetical protein
MSLREQTATEAPSNAKHEQRDRWISNIEPQN